jgi:hypothetical protein
VHRAGEIKQQPVARRFEDRARELLGKLPHRGEVAVDQLQGFPLVALHPRAEARHIRENDGRQEPLLRGDGKRRIRFHAAIRPASDRHKEAKAESR